MNSMQQLRICFTDDDHMKSKCIVEETTIKQPNTTPVYEKKQEFQAARLPLRIT
jgi:hypothetical protein